MTSSTNSDRYQSNPMLIISECPLAATYHPPITHHALPHFHRKVLQAQSQEDLLKAYKEFALARGVHANIPGPVFKRIMELEGA